MGLPNVMHTGRSAMHAAKTGISTTGHNIANANTEGYSRQRVELANNVPLSAAGTKALVGDGVHITQVNRLNDAYLEKQLRRGNESLVNLEEKEFAYRQVEDIFNELDGEGLNRLMSRFFNEFRRLANEPENEAIRQSVREASQALVNDLRRLRGEIKGVSRLLDNRVEGYTREINSLTKEVRDLNYKIKSIEIGTGSPPNDLLDRRDQAMKQLSSFFDIRSYTDEEGGYVVSLNGVGPLVVGPQAERFEVSRSPADDQGKPEGAYDVRTTASADSVVTHELKGGKLGALLEVRDSVVSTVLNRLDDLAFNLSNTVNQIHRQGVNRNGFKGIAFFGDLKQRHRAAEFIDLSDHIKSSVNNIAAAVEQDAPGDNRVALSLAGLQNLKIMNEGRSTMDDWYNSIVSQVGVLNARNHESLTQQKSIMKQLDKMREQVSGVSLDEETANLLQFQHVFDASAKVIQVADEMMQTVLSLKR